MEQYCFHEHIKKNKCSLLFKPKVIFNSECCYYLSAKSVDRVEIIAVEGRGQRGECGWQKKRSKAAGQVGLEMEYIGHIFWVTNAIRPIKIYFPLFYFNFNFCERSPRFQKLRARDPTFGAFASAQPYSEIGRRLKS